MNRKSLNRLLVIFLVFTAIFSQSAGVFAEKREKEVTAVSLNSLVPAETYTALYGKAEKDAFLINLSKPGTIFVDLSCDGNASIVLLKDSQGNRVDGICRTTSKTRERTLFFRVKEAGTYYLEFSSVDAFKVRTQFSVYHAPAGEISIELDKLSYGSGAAKAFYKVRVPETGYLTVEIPEYMFDKQRYEVSVLDQDKKNLYDNGYFLVDASTYTGYIGIKKGTYYIAVETLDPAYGIKISFNKSKENGGRTKKTAKYLAKGKTAEGIVPLTEKKGAGYWYKFTLKKAQSVKFTVSGLTSRLDEMKISVYDKNLKRLTRTSINSISDNYITLPVYQEQRKTLPAGTYYIKLEKNYYAGGYYKITRNK